MVRVFIKGGVWKNSEDEILKAAVMKYGKQQWARVASLLNRKSAKQCKARWHEWLDPSVKKVEWSRAEDEKLLHLAKLMPAQWKTIGPLVGGRTSVQCQERYERLLDEAAAAVNNNEEDGGGGGKDGDANAALASSARRLKPGDIDPHPETKPARPDPIDMDEDEIEMLQEARARLANTQGKKAKRKAREKMLNEAKRLADLQKRRELKQAGLMSGSARTSSRGGKRRRREIDFGVEIPFHKPAPAGFHDTTEEDERADRVRQKRLKDIDFKKVNESQYRSRDKEEKQAQKREEARLRALERSNMAYVVAEVSKKNDPIAARKRGVLNMPEPSVSDMELEKVAKLTKEQEAENAAVLMSRQEGGGSASATDALLGDYTDRPLPTPMRTPMTNNNNNMSRQEVILREASNLRMLERGETPLLGGDNPTLMDGGVGTGASLKAASSAGAVTPMIGGSETPMTVATEKSKFNQTPKTMAPRDELGLNRPTSQMHSGIGEGDDISISGTSFATTVGDDQSLRSMSIKEMAIAERKAAKRARKELDMALAALPMPQFEYDLATPDVLTDEEERDNMDVSMEKDAADVEAEKVAKLEKEAAKKYAERSSVVKRTELPRPFGAISRNLVFGSSEEPASESTETTAHQLIKEEMLTLLQHDAINHVVVPTNLEMDKKKSKKDKKKRKDSAKESNLAGPPLPPEKSLEYFKDSALDNANELIDKELQQIHQEKLRQVVNIDMNQSCFNTDGEFKSILCDATMSNSLQSITAPSTSHLREEFMTLKESAVVLRKRSDKLESKLNIKNGGYMKRAEALKNELLENFGQLQHSQIEEKVYTILMNHERKGIENRESKLKEEIAILETSEAAAQKKYGDLLHEKNRLLIRLGKN